MAKIHEDWEVIMFVGEGTLILFLPPMFGKLSIWWHDEQFLFNTLQSFFMLSLETSFNRVLPSSTSRIVHSWVLYSSTSEDINSFPFLIRHVIVLLMLIFALLFSYVYKYYHQSFQYFHSNHFEMSILGKF